MSPAQILLPLVGNEDVSKLYATRLTENDLAAVSFLDERSVSALPRGVVMDWIEAESESGGRSAALDFIFHVGHVGSTLLSRLLGRSPQILSVREPGILRTFAVMHGDIATGPNAWHRSTFDARLAALLQLWSQTFRAEQRTLLKATSFVSEMAAVLMGHVPTARAVLMRVAPESYLATILAGEGSRAELRVLGARRHARLRHRLGSSFESVPPSSEGELAAMSWACEATALSETAAASPDRTMVMDFDAFLVQPRDALAATLAFLGKETSEATLDAMMRSPDFQRYSKAPEHAYDAQLRRDVLNQARRDHRAEISWGLAWLERQAARFPALADTISARPPNSAIVQAHQ